MFFPSPSQTAGLEVISPSVSPASCSPVPSQPDDVRHFLSHAQTPSQRQFVVFLFFLLLLFYCFNNAWLNLPFGSSSVLSSSRRTGPRRFSQSGSGPPGSTRWCSQPAIKGTLWEHSRPLSTYDSFDPANCPAGWIFALSNINISNPGPLLGDLTSVLGFFYIEGWSFVYARSPLLQTWLTLLCYWTDNGKGVDLGRDSEHQQ